MRHCSVLNPYPVTSKSFHEQNQKNFTHSTELEMFTQLTLFLIVWCLSMTFTVAFRFRHCGLQYTSYLPCNVGKMNSYERHTAKPRGKTSTGTGREYSSYADRMKLKVARVLRDELSDIICSCDIRANTYPDTALLQGVTVTNIEFGADLSTAKVYLSIFGNSVEKRQVYVWLCNNIGQVRHSLAQRRKDLKRIPEIRFSLSDTQSEQYLHKILDGITTSTATASKSGSTEALDQYIDFEEE